MAWGFMGLEQNSCFLCLNSLGVVLVNVKRKIKVSDRESELAFRQNILQESWFYWFGFLVCFLGGGNWNPAPIFSVSALTEPQRAGSCFVLLEKYSVTSHFLKGELWFIGGSSWMTNLTGKIEGCEQGWEVSELVLPFLKGVCSKQVNKKKKKLC